MTEKTVSEMNASKKERFEFVLTINGFIVCQRYFRINGFRNESTNSIEMVDTIDKCVNLIDSDLKAKSSIYHYNAAPQVFENEAEMNAWLSSPNKANLEVPSYIILRDSDDVYVWDGEEAKLYEKYYNKADFVSSNDGEYQLKFAFIDNGPNYQECETHHEVCAKVWDGSIYPRFVRTNIDLSNSRNKYEGGDVYGPFESAMIKLFNSSQSDLIPVIVKEICNFCSNTSKDAYTTADEYNTVVDGKVVGTKSYNFDVQNSNYRYFKSLERAYKKKTDEYFKRA